LFTVFARGITGLNRFIGKVAAWVVIPLFLLLISDVLMRYFVGRPMIWTAELAQLVFGVYAILGGGYLLAERGHVNVDIFYGNFSRKKKAAVDVATSVLFFLFVGVLLWQGWSLAADSVGSWERSNSAWKPYIWPAKVAIPVAAVLLLLQGVVRLVGDIRVLLELPVDPAVYGTQPEQGHQHSAEEDAA
jgi:TRAP-type mannitol/chloroaromatic compound transport system permease small subunit